MTTDILTRDELEDLIEEAEAVVGHVGDIARRHLRALLLALADMVRTGVEELAAAFFGTVSQHLEAAVAWARDLVAGSGRVSRLRRRIARRDRKTQQLRERLATILAEEPIPEDLTEVVDAAYRAWPGRSGPAPRQGPGSLAALGRELAQRHPEHDPELIWRALKQCQLARRR